MVAELVEWQSARQKAGCDPKSSAGRLQTSFGGLGIKAWP